MRESQIKEKTQKFKGCSTIPETNECNRNVGGSPQSGFPIKLTDTSPIDDKSDHLQLLSNDVSSN